QTSRMEKLNKYFRDIFDLNEQDKNFLVFSPDESESNLMQPIFEETGRALNLEIRKQDEYISEHGRILEILSENTLQSWTTGYLLTGRHGVFVSYEAFFNIINSQIDQFIKFFQQTMQINWRRKIPSMNFVATSTGWRQEHNGFTHQNPSLINSLLIKNADFISIYLPADVNTMLVSMENSFDRPDSVNLIIADKRNLP